MDSIRDQASLKLNTCNKCKGCHVSRLLVNSQVAVLAVPSPFPKSVEREHSLVKVYNRDILFTKLLDLGVAVDQ